MQRPESQPNRLSRSYKLVPDRFLKRSLTLKQIRNQTFSGMSASLHPYNAN
ncbi:hypothetical protein AVDCRST_MAG92-4839 [uncultured Coleofasciculus sp.]|uniref:Uncharacterized protein n=1 Tax=uncultured Coleofasciculus sp. TaxID=1267456 RepID=A0A6J4K7S7_9CYAN|nr:hypothetical protein AVDCRST_MAG92-4839 [uncultured Coleofasciculus sp.]